MPETATETRERTPSAVFRALISVNVEPELAHDASEEVRDRAGENIIAAVRSSEDRINARLNARFDVLVAMIQSVQRENQSMQREISTLRWMIGIGFTLVSIFIAISTIIRS